MDLFSLHRNRLSRKSLSRDSTRGMAALTVFLRLLGAHLWAPELGTCAGEQGKSSETIKKNYIPRDPHSAVSELTVLVFETLDFARLALAFSHNSAGNCAMQMPRSDKSYQRRT